MQDDTLMLTQHSITYGVCDVAVHSDTKPVSLSGPAQSDIDP